jgi:hypothetical protein
MFSVYSADGSLLVCFCLKAEKIFTCNYSLQYCLMNFRWEILIIQTDNIDRLNELGKQEERAEETLIN